MSQKENGCGQLWSAGTLMWIVHGWEHCPTIHSLHRRGELLVSFREYLVNTVLLLVPRMVMFVLTWHQATSYRNREFLKLVILVAMAALNMHHLVYMRHSPGAAVEH